MTRMQTLTGIAVFAASTAGAVLSIQATMPLAAVHRTPPATTADADHPDAGDHSTRSCADMNGKRFNWPWGNAPFASSCDARPDTK